MFESTAVDTTKPAVTDRAPAAGATGVPTTGTTVSATFSESVVTGSPVIAVTNGTTAGGRHHVLRRQHANGDLHTVCRPARRDPDRQRHRRSRPAGNVMDPVTWSFTTATSSGGCPCTIWPSTAIPTTASTADSSAVELG